MKSQYHLIFDSINSKDKKKILTFFKGALCTFSFFKKILSKV